MYDFDVIIAGGGPAGLNAALYCARGGLNTLLLEKTFTGGQAATTYIIDNYIGFEEGIGGPELTMKMEAHVRRFGVRILHEEINELKLDGPQKTVVTTKGTYNSKVIIIATGGYSKELGLKNEKELRGMGISYCATCDGAFFRGKTVAVAGGGDTACEDAVFLSRFCEKVYLIHRRDNLRATKTLRDLVMADPKIEIIWNSVIAELKSGIDVLEEITLLNRNTMELTRLKVNGVFVAIGKEPYSDLVKGKLPLDANGYIITDEKMQTNIKGVYAVGDVRKKEFRQVITAAADGAIAAYVAGNYIADNGGTNESNN